MAGVEVRLLAASVDTMIVLREASVRDAIPLLAEHLLSWNLTDQNKDIIAFEAKAITRDIEPEIIRQIIGEWYKVAVGISAPLDPPSNDGQSRPDTEPGELFIPMEVQSVPQ